MIARKHLIREVLVFSLVLLLISLFIQGYAGISQSRVWNRLFFDQGSIFYAYKVYFFSLTIFILLEYFIVFEFPNNYLLSRAAGGAVFFLTVALLLGWYQSRYSMTMNIWLYLLFNFLAIVFGQFISYFFQRRPTIELSFYLGFANYFILLSVIIVFTFINIL